MKLGIVGDILNQKMTITAQFKNSAFTKQGKQKRFETKIVLFKFINMDVKFKGRTSNKNTKGAQSSYQKDLQREKAEKKVV